LDLFAERLDFAGSEVFFFIFRIDVCESDDVVRHPPVVDYSNAASLPVASSTPTSVT
jgi:hypothetical protein